jgi:endo-1,4-beta-D-glucanase Y
MITRRSMMRTAIAAVFPGALLAAPGWALWEKLAPRIVDAQGRVIDRTAGDRTTSEGQSYALFFSLVAGERERFEKILDWTQSNLAGGDLGARLPAWLSGGSSGGPVSILDANSASDADLWLAYTLLQAGRAWEHKRYTDLGLRLASLIAQQEVRDLPGLGAMLMPGATGFANKAGDVQLNPSYLPLQVFAGLAQAQPDGPWQRVADNVPRVIKGSAPSGYALDWVSYRSAAGFVVEPTIYGKPRASYDAIRVYLWAGMLAPGTPGRSQILQSLRGISDHLKKVAFPASEIQPDGRVSNAHSPMGFSAALLPYLAATGDTQTLARQSLRVRQRLNSGGDARYYDICLILFGLGWMEGRYHFDSKGKLILDWSGR